MFAKWLITTAKHITFFLTTLLHVSVYIRVLFCLANFTKFESHNYTVIYSTSCTIACIHLHKLSYIYIALIFCSYFVCCVCTCGAGVWLLSCSTEQLAVEVGGG